MAFLELNGMRKAFGSLVAVDDVGFAVEAGEIFGLLGPNGAGKSTTMMMLAGLVEPDAGTIWLDGRPLEHGDNRGRRLMGVVPQDLAIYPNLTGRENLQFFGRLYGVSRSELKTRSEGVLELIGLTPRADDLTGTYSGGMKRRLNFGAALLHEPRLLILDEPTVGVDPQSRAHLLNCVRQLGGEGVAVLYCSHYMEEVQELCDRVAIIDHGKVLACDRVARLLGRMTSEIRLDVEGLSDDAAQRLHGLNGVAVQREGSAGTVTLSRSATGGNGEDLLATLTQVLSLLGESGVRLVRLDYDEPNLERLFLEMTGSKLRE